MQEDLKIVVAVTLIPKAAVAVAPVTVTAHVMIAASAAPLAETKGATSDLQDA
jgi:hypothetical protein